MIPLSRRNRRPQDACAAEAAGNEEDPLKDFQKLWQLRLFLSLDQFLIPLVQLLCHAFRQLGLQKTPLLPKFLFFIVRTIASK